MVNTPIYLARRCVSGQSRHSGCAGQRRLGSLHTPLQTLSPSTPRVQEHPKSGSKDEHYPRRAGQEGGSATAKVVCLPGKLQVLALLLATCYTHARKAKNKLHTTQLLCLIQTVNSSAYTFLNLTWGQIHYRPWANHCFYSCQHMRFSMHNYRGIKNSQ